MVTTMVRWFPFGERIASLSVALDSDQQVMFYGGSFYSNVRVN